VTQGEAECDTAIAAMQALAQRLAQQDLAPADVALRVQGSALVAGQLGGGRSGRVTASATCAWQR
jgi:hypothetical protein